VDYNVLFKKVRDIIEEETDSNHIIRATGEPMLVGWIYSYRNELYLIFGITCFAFLGLLYYYFRNLLGVLVHVPPIILGVVWFLGFCGLLGYSLEPLTLVIPMLITARSLSHSVQFTERYFEFYQELKDVKKACIETTASVFPPGLLGIITDSLGIFLIAVAPIPMMQKLALVCGFWAFSIIFTGQLLTPILISFFSPPKNIQDIVDTQKGLTPKILGVISGMSYGKAGVVTFILLVVLAGFTGWVSSKVEIGDINPGTPILWEDSDYNVAIDQINRNFPGTEELYVIFEGAATKAVEDPEFLKIIDSFQRKIEKSPLASSSLSIVDLLPPVHRQIFGGYPKLETLPISREETAQIFYILLGHAAPGDYDRYVSGDTQIANVVIWYKDHVGDTIRSAIATVKEFMKKNEDLLAKNKVKIQLASGSLGVLAAMNETIVESQFINLVMVMGVIFILCSITYRSIVAALILMVPLNMANFITLAIMHALGIGLNVNTLPIVSVGVGVGIDYGIYLLTRICEEYQKGGGEYSLTVSTKAIKTTGKAIFFTATSMIFGVIFWFFFSSLRFQAEMGLLLAIIMFINMIGALILIPTLTFIFKPRFLGKTSMLVKG